MEIRVNLGAIGTDLGQTIEAKLTEKQLPGCLGNMIPPMLSKVMDIDSDELFAPTDSIKLEDKVEVNMKEFIIQGNADNLSLTKEGLEKVELTKINLATIYADKLSKCVICPHENVCDKLTKNYLAIIALEKSTKEN